MNLTGASRYINVWPKAFFWIIFLLILGLDMLTKWLVMQHMTLDQSIPVLGDFVRLTYVRNPGAAFSLFADFNHPVRPVLLIGVNVLVAVVLMVIVHLEKKPLLWQIIPFGFVSAGAIGNVLDRITTGTVVDFVELKYHQYSWPVFNVADSAVLIGVCWLVFLSFRNPSKRA